MVVLNIGNTQLKNLNNHNYNTGKNNNQVSFREDGRGKHTPKHAASSEETEAIKQHILSFPREASHYSLGKKHTLNPELSVKIMHGLYREQQQEAGGRVLGYAKYLQIFKNMGLKFGRYACDTCSLCDSYREKLEVDPDDEETKEEREKHLREADIAYAQQKYDYHLSQENSNVEAVWFDMAAIIQIPKTPSSKAFYLRKYRTSRRS